MGSIHNLLELALDSVAGEHPGRMNQLLERLIRDQDGILAREQGLDYLTESEIHSRLGRTWQVVLPGIYATFTGSLTIAQRRRAALLHAGSTAMLTDLDALDLAGLRNLPLDNQVRVLVANTVQRASRDFVVIRRTTRLPRAEVVAGLSIAPVDRAVCDFALRAEDDRSARAVALAAVQERRTTVAALRRESERAAARGRPRLLRIVADVAAGVRSIGEADYRSLTSRSTVLPVPLWNPLLRLATGMFVSPDALYEDAALIHETNGRQFHAGIDDFEDMQRRHDALVAAGFTVLHNSPRRVINEGKAVLAEVEACYERLAGRGMPSDVEIIRRSAA